MSENHLISLDDAKKRFLDVLHALDESDIESFKSFVYEELKSLYLKNNGTDDGLHVGEKMDNCSNVVDDPVFLLNTIVSDIKKRLPIEAILPSEKITLPKFGENSDCLPDITIHVDEFLYDEDDVENLVEEGKLKRHYCQECGSKNVEPLIFLSHSTSRDALYYIFNTRLPKLDGKVVLDVGSRLGAVLYGAYAYTDAKKIIGVEMNEEFCILQRDIVQKYQMQNRVEIIHDRIENLPEVVRSANVIVINNSFEFYLPESEQVSVWMFLKNCSKKGTIIVARPHIEVTFKHLNTGIKVEEWLKLYENLENHEDFIDEEMDMERNEAFCDIAFYEVL